jgi:Arc/MetJ family transcription regulator
MCKTYPVAVGRTNIEIDDELIGRVMALHGCASKREAVDLALTELLGDWARPMTREEALAMEGAGWEADLDEMRTEHNPIIRSWLRGKE